MRERHPGIPTDAHQGCSTNLLLSIGTLIKKGSRYYVSEDARWISTVRVFSTPSNSLSRSPQRTASQRGNCSADVPTTMPVMQGYSLANYPKAVCVDSSPAMYYFLAATSVASANTWIVYLRGGGVCMPYFAVRRHPCS